MSILSKELAALAVVPLNRYRPVIVGNDATLTHAASRRSKLLHSDNLVELFPSLTAVKWKADCFVINAISQTPDAALHLFQQALAHMEHQGEAVIITDAATYYDHIFDFDVERHVWAVLRYDGVCLIWFAKDHDSRDLACADATADTLTEAQNGVTHLAQNRIRLRPGAEATDYIEAPNTVKLWQAVQTELKATRGFTLSLSAGHIVTHLSAFDLASGRISETDAARLRALDGKTLLSLVVMKESRRELEKLVNSQQSTVNSDKSRAGIQRPTWTVCPKLHTAVTEAIAEMEVLRAPLYALPPLQRLGFLDEQESIVCRKDFSLNSQTQKPCSESDSEFMSSGLTQCSLYLAGKTYPIRSTLLNFARTGTRLNTTGEREAVVWEGREMAFYISSTSVEESRRSTAKADTVEYCFMDARYREPTVRVSNPSTHPPIHQSTLPRRSPTQAGVRIDFTLQDLVNHFTVPEVPDVASVFPDRYQDNLKALDEIMELINA